MNTGEEIRLLKEFDRKYLRNEVREAFQDKKNLVWFVVLGIPFILLIFLIIYIAVNGGSYERESLILGTVFYLLMAANGQLPCRSFFYACRHLVCRPLPLLRTNSITPGTYPSYFSSSS